MPKAIIVYLSKKGTTKYYGHNIGKHIESKDISVDVKSIYDVQPEEVANYDIVLLGAWTHGLFLLFQHPDKPWKEFAQKLPSLADKKIGLFTTYKIATGVMFKKMQSIIGTEKGTATMFLKARGEELTNANINDLEKWIESGTK